MSRTVYVGRLPRDATKVDVEEHFQGLGRIKEVRLMSNFGFVEFESPDDVEVVCRELDGQPLLGERLIVEPSRDARRRDVYDPLVSSVAPAYLRQSRAPRGGPRSRGVRVSVVGISDATSWQDLKDFGRNGCESVIFADIDRNTGNGVIEYPTIADAEDAIRRLDGTEIHGVPVRVEIQESAGRDSWDRPPPRDYGRRYESRDSYRPRERSPPRYDRRDSRRDDRTRYEGRYDEGRRPRDSERFEHGRERSPRRDRDSPRRGHDSPRREPESPRRERESPRRDREDGSPPPSTS